MTAIQIDIQILLLLLLLAGLQPLLLPLRTNA